MLEEAKLTDEELDDIAGGKKHKGHKPKVGDKCPKCLEMKNMQYNHLKKDGDFLVCSEGHRIKIEK